MTNRRFVGVTNRQFVTRTRGILTLFPRGYTSQDLLTIAGHRHERQLQLCRQYTHVLTPYMHLMMH